MAIILAIDPGTTKSAIVVYDTDARKLLEHSIEQNENVTGYTYGGSVADVLAIEMVASYGMPVGQEVFETCVWSGRFIESWGHDFIRLYRKQIVTYLCGSARANDAAVRQRLIDIFGGSKEAAIGKKAAPGPLYGVRADEWSALAIALTAESVLKEKSLLAGAEKGRAP